MKLHITKNQKIATSLGLGAAFSAILWIVEYMDTGGILSTVVYPVAGIAVLMAISLIAKTTRQLWPISLFTLLIAWSTSWFIAMIPMTWLMYCMQAVVTALIFITIHKLFNSWKATPRVKYSVSIIVLIVWLAIASVLDFYLARILADMYI